MDDNSDLDCGQSNIEGDTGADYVAQLKAVFDSCDSDGTGYLNKVRLVDLCRKLQLEDQAHLFVHRLLGDDTDALIDFGEFKDGFISILSATSGSNDCGSAALAMGDSDNDASANIADSERPDDPGCDSKKQYGRRSKPNDTISSDIDVLSEQHPGHVLLSNALNQDTDFDVQSDFSDPDNDVFDEQLVDDKPAPQISKSNVGSTYISSGTGEVTKSADHSSSEDDSSNSCWSFSNRRREMAPRKRRRTSADGNGRSEVVNAKKQMDSKRSLINRPVESSINRSYSEAGLTSKTFEDDSCERLDSQAAYLHSAFNELGVAKSGYLEFDDLAKVCRHIGMEAVSNEIVMHLFEKLDTDCDGRISFDEFLRLFKDEKFLGPQLRRTSLTPDRLSSVRQTVGSPSNNGCLSAVDLSPSKTADIDIEDKGALWQSVRSVSLDSNLNIASTDMRTRERHKSNGVAGRLFGLRQPGTIASAAILLHQRSEEVEYDDMGPSGLFTAVDDEETGFASCEALADMWDSIEVTNNGLHILDGLGFGSTTGGVNLKELSQVLENIIRTNFDGSPDDRQDESSYALLRRVAVATCFHEIKHSRLVIDQLRAERDKLKQNITDSNSRAVLLAQEVDEHHARMEKSTRDKLTLAERRCNEQMNSLQESLQAERDQLMAQASLAKQEYEGEVGAMRAEEERMRGEMHATLRENGRLEADVRRLMRQLSEADKMSKTQQQEIQNLQECKKKLSDLDRNHLLMDEERLSQLTNQLELCKLENKLLKDHNDELSSQCDHLKQQLTNRLFNRTGPTSDVCRHRKHSNMSNSDTASVLSCSSSACSGTATCDHSAPFDEMQNDGEDNCDRSIIGFMSSGYDSWLSETTTIASAD